MTFGDGTLILSNRPIENGVEVVATGEDSLASLDQGNSGFGQGKPSTSQQRNAEPSFKEIASQVEEDANQLAMSTLSFQDYVRERMARRRQEAGVDNKILHIPRDDAPATRPVEPRPSMLPQQLQQQVAAEPVPQVIKVSPPARPEPVTPAPQVLSPNISRELNAMKDLIEDRFNTLNWLGQARQNPIQANLMLKLIRAGYSPTLSRTILERMPETADPAQSLQWVMDVLERNLHTDANGTALHQEGGVFALIGATGVGKTTTAAKLAGLCARAHGPNSVGLITLDSYRVGAQEQLRAYGKMLGIVAHLAQTCKTLRCGAWSYS